MAICRGQLASHHRAPLSPGLLSAGREALGRVSVNACVSFLHLFMGILHVEQTQVARLMPEHSVWVAEWIGSGYCAYLVWVTGYEFLRRSHQLQGSRCRLKFLTEVTHRVLPVNGCCLLDTVFGLRLLRLSSRDNIQVDD